MLARSCLKCKVDFCATCLEPPHYWEPSCDTVKAMRLRAGKNLDKRLAELQSAEASLKDTVGTMESSLPLPLDNF